MKYILLLLAFNLIIVSCSTNEKKDLKTATEEENENPIVGKWKLNIHSQKDANDKQIDLKHQPTEVILSIMDGGYFVIYDTFIDPKFNQKGFNRISERSKGQWEMINNKKLILHHNYDDSTTIEELSITKLTNKMLITKGKDKKANIYKTYEGY